MTSIAWLVSPRSIDGAFYPAVARVSRWPWTLGRDRECPREGEATGIWFPQTVEYALRALAVLARAEGVAMSAAEFVERATVSAPYVSKVMRRLGARQSSVARPVSYAQESQARPLREL